MEDDIAAAYEIIEITCAGAGGQQKDLRPVLEQLLAELNAYIIMYIERYV